MKFLKRLIFSLFFVHQLFLTKEDLPVNCKFSDIEGDWIFELTKGNKINLIQNNCGHQFPDDERTSANAFENAFIKDESKSLKCKLERQGNIECNEKKYPFTMVYNEGIYFEINNVNYFMFFYYKLNESVSICSKTIVGWYHNKLDNSRGCVKGYLNNNMERVIKHQKKKILFENIQNEDYVLSRNQNYSLDFRFKSKTFKIKKSVLQNNDLLIKEINSKQNLWKAKMYPMFAKMSFTELNAFVGRKNFRNNLDYFENNPKMNFQFKETESEEEYFSWENCLSLPISQGKCGSCFAISTIAMLEARKRIQKRKCEPISRIPEIELRNEIQKKKSLNSQEDKISLDYVLDCSFYNQGCDGGYPFLVGKFGFDHYLAFKSHYKKQKTNFGDIETSKNECDLESKYGKSLKKLRIKDFKYLTGKYEITSEHLIRKEIKENGPIVLSFSPSRKFAFYEKGVYGDCSSSEKSKLDQEWTKVDHSVLAFGYGKDENGPFWILQNSWGEWGEEGNFRMRSGCNIDGIESMVEIANPLIEE